MALCILAEGFFAGSEIAIVSVNRAHLQHLVDKGSSRARALSRILENPEWFLGTTLLGTNLATITLNVVATLYVIRTFGSEYEMATMIVTAPLVLVFGEVLPKAFYQRFSDRIAPLLVRPLQIISIVIAPLVATVALIARGASHLSGITVRKKTPLLTREELELVFQASERREGVKDLERRMIDRIFDFSEHRAGEIMIPLAKVISLREDATLEEAALEIRRSGFSRILVFSDRAYDIVGWVHHSDILMAENKMSRVRTVVRSVRFVPAAVELDQLLFTLQRAGDSLAVVVDEYGGAIGLVTMEDILEEVVGEIEDEYDKKMPSIKTIDPHRFVVSAHMPVDQINEHLRNAIPDGDYETVGGFLLAQLQRIPKKGEEYRYKKLVFRILEANAKSIEKIEVAHP